MTLVAYQSAVAGNPKLKLRAKALLAEGEPEQRFEAAVLYHEAARAEGRALALLQAPTVEAALASTVEQCGCLINGLDPFGAARLYGEVLEREREVAPKVARALRARLEPAYRRLQREWSALLKRCPELNLILSHQESFIAPRSSRFEERELRVALDEYPGAWPFWYMSYRTMYERNELAEAWQALHRALALEPGSTPCVAMSLDLIPRLCDERPDVLNGEAADRHLAAVFRNIRTAVPEVCCGYAFAELLLARNAPRRDVAARTERAAAAAREGLSRAAEHPSTRALLRAALAVAEALQSGEVPTLDALYRAGLGRLAITSGDGNPVELLVRYARSEMSALVALTM